MDRPGLMDWLIAPLTWLERATGWKRLGLLGLYGMTVLVVGVLGWRTLSLWRLPDIGEPFDIARYRTVQVADADNAMILYERATKKLIPRASNAYKVPSSKAWEHTDWSTADPELRRWAVDNRPAFDLWLEGTRRPDALLVQPGELTHQSIFNTAFTVREFASMAILEASRLEAAGDIEGVWNLHRANLRSSRHVGMHGGQFQRLTGLGILVRVRPEIERWIDKPGLTPARLRRAIDDVATCKAMTSPMSDTVRAEYFTNLSLFDIPEIWYQRELGLSDGESDWINRLTFVRASRQFLRREPERSQRVLKLLTAGRLAQCDRPPAVRPKLVSVKFSIFDRDPWTPATVAGLTPEELERWAESSVLAVVGGDLSAKAMTRLDGEPGLFDSLLIRMAERAFEIEHGKPAKTYADLLGSYLKALPDGIEAIDRIRASTEPE